MESIQKVRDFIYKNRRCIVLKMTLPFGTFGIYHNGYVELKPNEIKDDYNSYNMKSDEITYIGKLDRFAERYDFSDGKTYIGFDSAHYWNIGKPKSRTADYVEHTCKKIVNELEKHRK